MMVADDTLFLEEDKFGMRYLYVIVVFFTKLTVHYPTANKDERTLSRLIGMSAVVATIASLISYAHALVNHRKYLNLIASFCSVTTGKSIVCRSETMILALPYIRCHHPL